MSPLKNYILAFTLFNVLPLTVKAQSDTAIGPNNRHQLLNTKQLYLYGGMMCYGVMTNWITVFKAADINIQNQVTPVNSKKTNLDDYLQFGPGMITLGLEASGVRGSHRPTQTLLLNTISNVLANGLVTISKTMTHKLRPDGSNYASFPSGHTAAAFASAELMRLEYKDRSPWYGITGYIMASSTGYLRIYNNRHWFGDVLAGAAVGIVATRVSYWIYERVKQKKLL